MSCEICLLDSAVDPAILSCAGCSRIYHAACVGIPSSARAGIPISTRSSLRKKEKTMDVLDFVLPCCKSCQNLITLNFDFHLLVEQQRKLADDINSNTQVLHTSNKLDKMDMVHEAIDRIEGLLVANKKEVMAGRDTVIIKNHLTSLLNISMEATRKRIDDYVEDLTGDLTRELKNICAEVEKLSTLTIEMANHCAEHNKPPSPARDIIEELKSLTNSVGGDILSQVKSVASKVSIIESSLESNVSNARHLPSTASPSLIAELVSEPNAVCDLDTSGWRLLGTKRVYKSDWSQYDARKSVREKQQKMAVKAKIKRKKQSKSKESPKNLENAIRSRKNSNIPRRHTDYNNVPNNLDQSQRSPRQRYNRDGNNPKKNTSNVRQLMQTSNHNRNNLLPLDRDLLAEAKDRFSRPPTYQPLLQFQKGETLNPYPVSDGRLHQATHTTNWMVPAQPSTSTGSYGACVCSCTKHRCF